MKYKLSSGSSKIGLNMVTVRDVLDSEYMIIDECKSIFSNSGEFCFGDWFIHNHIFVSADRNITVGIELCGLLAVNLSQSFLLFVIG